MPWCPSYRSSGTMCGTACSTSWPSWAWSQGTRLSRRCWTAPPSSLRTSSSFPPMAARLWLPESPSSSDSLASCPPHLARPCRKALGLCQGDPCPDSCRVGPRAQIGDEEKCWLGHETEGQVGLLAGLRTSWPLLPAPGESAGHPRTSMSLDLTLQPEPS